MPFKARRPAPRLPTSAWPCRWVTSPWLFPGFCKKRCLCDVLPLAVCSWFPMGAKQVLEGWGSENRRVGRQAGPPAFGAEPVNGLGVHTASGASLKGPNHSPWGQATPGALIFQSWPSFAKGWGGTLPWGSLIRPCWTRRTWGLLAKLSPSRHQPVPLPGPSPDP